MSALRHLAILAVVSTSAFAQAPAPTLDMQDMQKAEQLSGDGKYAEALKLYQGIEKNYPTSPFIPGSRLGMAICQFFLKDYDKAVESVTKNLTAAAKDPTKIPGEILERSMLLIPQIQSAKAEQAPPDQPTVREKSYKDAIKGFDEFTKKFPRSPEVETALAGKGSAMAYIEDFEGAVKALKEGLDKFPNSPTVQDTKFMYGLVNSFQAIKAIRNLGDKADAAAKTALDEAEKTFREIINARQDLVLMNNSYMQIGEILSLRAAELTEDAEQQKKWNEQALEFYRNVRSKEEVIAAVGDNSVPGGVGGPDEDACTEFHPARAPEGLFVMIEEGKLSRITLTELSKLKTADGFGLGEDPAAIKTFYGARAAATPHKYQDKPAEYVTVWKGAARSEPYVQDPAARGFVYEVDGTGKVGAIHAGGPSIQYVEGCA